jgi:hypothetical protein
MIVDTLGVYCIYLRIQEIKSILNVLYHNQSNGSKCVIDVCRTLPTFEKTDLGHVRQQSVSWEKVFNRTRGYKKIRLIRSLKKFIFRYQDLVEIYSVSAKTMINDGFSYSENV